MYVPMHTMSREPGLDRHSPHRGDMQTEKLCYIGIWVVVKIIVPFWGPYFDTAPSI